jgi:[acyl-carrier-protein] S-malonyltransferase
LFTPGTLIRQLEEWLGSEETTAKPHRTMSTTHHIILCPGQGAQAVGMGRAWLEKSAAARGVFDEADRVLGSSLGAPLSHICFNGPAERLNQTDVSQPAIYATSVACWRGLLQKHGEMPIRAAAGLSLGEYTALHIAGVFDFATGLQLVAERGRLMQEAAVTSKGGMVAIIGADDAQSQAVCDRAVAQSGGVLVCANFNAPGQIVLSGSAEACSKAVAVAGEMGLKATALTVAGAFHSPLMQPAADQMGEVLSKVAFSRPRAEVWSNVTARPHVWDGGGMESRGAGELLKRRLVEQIVSPVCWSQTCSALASGITSDQAEIGYHELAPGTVLRGLMRRIDRERKVQSHDQPED